jgi:hypothetical protein
MTRPRSSRFLLAGAGLLAGLAFPTGPVSAAPRPAPPRTVDTAATPRGWVPVDDGDARISVPADWSLATAGAAECGPSPGVVLLDGAQWCPPNVSGPTSPTTSVVSVRTVTTAHLTGRPTATIRGLAVFAPGVAPVYVVPALHVEISFSGPSQPAVLRTLTASPRAVVLAGGPAPAIPRSWRWHRFAGLRFATPASWPQRDAAAPCGYPTRLALPGITLATHQPPPVPCPFLGGRPVAPVSGIEVDDYPAARTLVTGPCVRHARTNGLAACIAAAPAYDVLVLRATPPGHPPVTVQIGLAGDGTVARAVLASLRPA